MLEVSTNGDVFACKVTSLAARKVGQQLTRFDEAMGGLSVSVKRKQAIERGDCGVDVPTGQQAVRRYGKSGSLGRQSRLAV